jgi:predicted RNA binding protein YcfA (HicA-like mRNA interferase family)
MLRNQRLEVISNLQKPIGHQILRERGNHATGAIPELSALVTIEHPKPQPAVTGINAENTFGRLARHGQMLSQNKITLGVRPKVIL